MNCFGGLALKAESQLLLDRDGATDGLNGAPYLLKCIASISQSLVDLPNPINLMTTSWYPYNTKEQFRLLVAM
jgi:hypothetical protein